MSVQFISIDKDHRWQNVKAKEIAAMIGKPVYVEVNDGPRQVPNAGRVSVGVLSSVHFHKENATGGRPGEGLVRFADGTAAHWRRSDVIVITVIEQEG